MTKTPAQTIAPVLGPKAAAWHRLATREKERADGILARFAEKFASDPMRAFEWSQDAFQAAAVSEATSTLLRYVDSLAEGKESDDEIGERIAEWLRSEVLRMAKYPPRSTSPQSNLVEQEKLAAYARLLERAGEVL